MIQISSGYQFPYVHYVQYFNFTLDTEFLRVLDVLRIRILRFPEKSLFVILPHRSRTRDFLLEGKRRKIYPKLTSTLTQNNAALTRAPHEQGESSG
jgi:hypothetical protein